MGDVRSGLIIIIMIISIIGMSLVGAKEAVTETGDYPKNPQFRKRLLVVSNDGVPTPVAGLGWHTPRMASSQWYMLASTPRHCSLATPNSLPEN